MLITFEMVSENININYKVFGKKNDNTLIFPDKSVPNTMMHVSILTDSVEIVRTGDVEMKQTFKFNEKTDGYYKNNLGLEFNISSFTTELSIEENAILIFYEHYLDNNWQSSNKLKIIF